MKTFEQLTIKQVKKKILYWEQDNENPKSIEVVCVWQKPDSDPYVQGDGSTCEHFFAVVLIDGVKHCMGYEWDCDDENITGSWDDDVTGLIETDSNNDDELPENVVERCDYVGLIMGMPVIESNVENVEDLYAELKVPVTHVRWNYPFEVREGSYIVYPIEEAHTWLDLLSRISEVFEDEYNEHVTDHALSGYIIELLEIHPNGLATVHFGS